MGGGCISDWVMKWVLYSLSEPSSESLMTSQAGWWILGRAEGGASIPSWVLGLLTGTGEFSGALGCAACLGVTMAVQQSLVNINPA